MPPVQPNRIFSLEDVNVLLKISLKNVLWFAVWPSSEVEPSMAAQIIRTACETGADLVRRRRMSPSEAWACEAYLPQ